MAQRCSSVGACGVRTVAAAPTATRYGVGKRMSLKVTRAIIDAIHSGGLVDAQYVNLPTFDLQVGAGGALVLALPPACP